MKIVMRSELTTEYEAVLEKEYRYMNTIMLLLIFRTSDL